MAKYVVVYFKNLNRDSVLSKDFDDEQELTSFVEDKRDDGYSILVGEASYLGINGEKAFKMRKYGSYALFKYVHIYLGIILFAFSICLILFYKLRGFR